MMDARFSAAARFCASVSPRTSASSSVACASAMSSSRTLPPPAPPLEPLVPLIIERRLRELSVRRSPPRLPEESVRRNPSARPRRLRELSSLAISRTRGFCFFPEKDARDDRLVTLVSASGGSFSSSSAASRASASSPRLLPLLSVDPLRVDRLPRSVLPLCELRDCRSCPPTILIHAARRPGVKSARRRTPVGCSLAARSASSRT